MGLQINSFGQGTGRSRIASFSPFTGRRCRQADEGRRRAVPAAGNLSALARPLIRPSGPPSPPERGEGKRGAR
ncbi:hypothetical protein FJ934_00650 [Mesorhizobium sp. B2-4-12]|nr:hypothetical protein FJ934_00650 [Mesorhizobium sp. B2-4-12]